MKNKPLELSFNMPKETLEQIIKVANENNENLEIATLFLISLGIMQYNSSMREQ